MDLDTDCGDHGFEQVEPYQMSFETFCALQRERIRQLPCSGGACQGKAKYKSLSDGTRQTEMKQCRVIEQRVMLARKQHVSEEQLPRGVGCS